MLDYAELFMPSIQQRVGVTPEMVQDFATKSLDEIIVSTQNENLRTFLKLSHNHGAPLNTDGARTAAEFLTCDDVLCIADGAWFVKPRFEPFVYAAMILSTGENE